MITAHRIPHYKVLYDSLKIQIREGVYKEGELLPSENELCQLHNLTRPTVRHALDALLNEGFIKKRKGKGSIVNQIPNGIGLLSIRGTTSVIGKSNLKTNIIIKPKTLEWPVNFSFPLIEAELTAGCIYMERLRLVNDVPVFYEKSYIPNINLPRFVSKNFENKSLFEMLRKHYQIEVKSGEQKFKAIPSDETISKFLNVPFGSPILYFERKHNTNRDDFRFYSLLFCNTDQYALYGTF
jgi:DNA-binding GntR family transcriptional regulator